MKKVLLMTSTLLFLMPALTYAEDQIIIAEDQITMQSSPKKMSKENESDNPSYIEYHNRMVVLTINNLTYEFIKPNSLYAATDSWVTGALSSHHDGVNLVLESELRFGYNYFYNGRDHVTPCGGIGFFKDFKKEHHATLPGIVYVMVGMRYDHEFTDVVNVGMNMKALFGGSVSSGHHKSWNGFVGGVEVSFPVTFRFGPLRHWDARVEPFDILLAGKHQSVNYFGARLTAGYRF